MKTLLIIGTLCTLLSAAEYSIIISKKIALTEISAQQIRDIYLMKRHTVGNQKIIPLNLLGQDASRIAFENEFLAIRETFKDINES